MHIFVSNMKIILSVFSKLEKKPHSIAQKVQFWVYNLGNLTQICKNKHIK